jgi:hypothetical protein
VAIRAPSASAAYFRPDDVRIDRGLSDASFLRNHCRRLGSPVRLIFPLLLMRSAISSGCSMKLDLDSMTPGITILLSGNFTVSNKYH